MKTPVAPSAAVRAGYLLSRYPAISHTFFLKEVLGLRERGLGIEVASINVPDRPRAELPESEATESDRTFYIKAGGILRLALRVLAIAARNPTVVFRGLSAALRLGDWNLKARAFAIFYLAEALLVGDWMRRKSLNHLHVHFGGPVATVGMLVAEAWDVPWSVTLHGPDEFFDQEEFYLRKKIDSASFVICISDFCRSQVLRIAPETPDGRIEVVRLGVDCAALRPKFADRASDGDSAEFGVDRKAPLRLVCTGRMVAAKGHRILLEALALLAESGAEFSCALIGSGPERSFLENLGKRLGISDRVDFLGARAHRETLHEVSQADVFVLASFAEGLPVALMEAMAVGVPCVSTTIAAIPELIENGENGLLVPPASPEALFKALARLAGDPRFRRQLGDNARTTVVASYDLARNLDTLAAMLVRRLNDESR